MMSSHHVLASPQINSPRKVGHIQVTKFEVEGDGPLPEFEERQYENELSDIIITEETIDKLISHLKPSKSPGPDNFHPKLLKETHSAIKTPLRIIFQKSVEEGKLPEVIFGPMFSGKTTELMRRMKRYQIANYKCLIVKYAKDTRYVEEGIATHDRQSLPAVAAEKLSDMTDLAKDYEIIGIDEGQFFPDVVSFCDQMADKGKIVIVAALDGTFQRQGFGDILNLVPLAENVIKLSAVCMTCNSDGHFTKRTTKDKSVEVIGGADMYQAVCRDCFKSPVKKSPRKSPCKSSPYKTPESHKSVPLADLTNRQLFISPQKN